MSTLDTAQRLTTAVVRISPYWAQPSSITPRSKRARVPIPEGYPELVDGVETAFEYSKNGSGETCKTSELANSYGSNINALCDSGCVYLYMTVDKVMGEKTFACTSANDISYGSSATCVTEGTQFGSEDWMTTMRGAGFRRARVPPPC